MYHVAPLHPLHDAILDSVAKQPNITMAELHASVCRQHKLTTSLQHVYRTVGAMLEEQILVKSKGKLSLNLMWLSYITFFAEQAKRRALEKQRTERVFPLKEGQKKSFEVQSLLEVETMWNHLLVQLRRSMPHETRLYKYYSHAWWQLKTHDQDLQFYQKLALHGIRCHWLFGNTTFLDTHAADRIRTTFPAVTTDTPPFPAQGYNVNVYGQHILECIFSDQMSQRFQAAFERITSIEQCRERAFLDLFLTRCPCIVTVWRNAEQAELLRQRLAAYFA